MKWKSVFEYIRQRVEQGRRQYWILLDPDDFSSAEAGRVARLSEKSGGVDAVLIGGSLLQTGSFDEFVKTVKRNVSMPVILFPGDATQLSKSADALLFLSLISGRNPVNLIGEHVKAAPLIRALGIEPIATAYMLIESGAVTSVEFMSNTRPLPRAKPDIAAAHALAAQYMGMHMIYLEAGSGAQQPVSCDMIRRVKSYIDIPLIVGGGIRDAQTARFILEAGADIIVTGNMLQKKDGLDRMKEIAAAVKRHGKSKKR
jgi:phosphoglycerol geranylgeranyltransferase